MEVSEHNTANKDPLDTLDAKGGTTCDNLIWCFKTYLPMEDIPFKIYKCTPQNFCFSFINMMNFFSRDSDLTNSFVRPCVRDQNPNMSVNEH